MGGGLGRFSLHILSHLHMSKCDYSHLTSSNRLDIAYEKSMLSARLYAALLCQAVKCSRVEYGELRAMRQLKHVGSVRLV